MSVNLFDANFYRAANKDLVAAGLTTNAQLLSHFQGYGLNEGRSFSPFANLNLYRSSNPDLVAAGLTTNQQLFNHLQSNGVAEGRRFSEFVDIKFYLNANPDVNQAFQGNREQAFNHLNSIGVGEGRRFSEFFDINRYANNNPDLPTGYANSIGKRPYQVAADPGFRQFLLNHFELFGVNEGRDFSSTFNLNYYRDTNSDLAAARLNNKQLYQHFELNGLNEGRASSSSFNVSYYLANNGDLRVAGFNNSKAYDHFILYGQREGRRGSQYGSFLTGAEVSAGTINLQTGNQTINASLSGSDRPNPTRLASYSDDYRLTGVAIGQRVQLNMNASFDTYLQLVNASTGQVISEDDDSGPGTNSQLSFTVQSGIDYIIRSSSYDAQSIGSYTLTAVAASTIVGSIAANQSINGYLSSSDYENPTRTGSYRDDYSLTGVSAGQQVQINLEANYLDTYLQLVNASTGEVIDYNDDADNSTTDSKLSFTVQSGINYIIRVGSYYANSTGYYSLSSTTSGSASIVANQTVAGSLDSTDTFSQNHYYDYYQLTGVSVGQQIRINLNSSAFDTQLYLVNANNNSTILFNDDSGSGTTNSELSFTVQSGINYSIWASSYSNYVTGSYTLTTTSGSTTQDWFTQNIADTGLQNIVRTRATDGTLDRNDMLAIFRDAEDNSVVDSTEVADLRTLAANSTRFRMPDYVGYLSTRVSEGATANLSASQFESNVLARWFLGTVAPTAQFSEQGGNTKNFSYTQVQGTLFGSSGHARIGDIDQGGLGDCAFLSALGATFGPQSNDSGDQRSSVIDSMIIDNGDNTYTIRFYSNATPSWVTVNRYLATYNNQLFAASANGSRNPNNSSNVLWAPLVERAYAQWREFRENAPGYNLIGNGDYINRPLEFVTGRTATTYYGSNFMSVSFNQIANALQSGQAIELGSTSSGTSYIVGGHAYALTYTYTSSSNEQRIIVRNPWGVDNNNGVFRGDANDGFLDLSFSEFRSSFQGIAFA